MDLTAMGLNAMCYSLTITPDYQVQQSKAPLRLIRPVGSGINEPWYGYLGEHSGYFKSCANTDSEMDEVEVWLSFLGERLGVNMARTYLVLDENCQKLGSFSTDVAEAGGTYLSADQIKRQWLSTLDCIPQWAVRAYQIHMQAEKVQPFPDHIYSIVEEPEKLTEILQFVYGLLTRGNQYDVRASFTDMILFDCMTWQKDRNMNGFGVVEQDTGDCRMAGLYDNATVSIPGVDDHYNGFCNVLCSWQTLAQCIWKMFPEQALDFSNRLDEFLTRETDQYRQLQGKVISATYHQKLLARMEGWEDLVRIIGTASGMGRK